MNLTQTSQATQSTSGDGCRGITRKRAFRSKYRMDFAYASARALSPVEALLLQTLALNGLIGRLTFGFGDDEVLQ